MTTPLEDTACIWKRHLVASVFPLQLWFNAEIQQSTTAQCIDNVLASHIKY